MTLDEKWALHRVLLNELRALLGKPPIETQETRINALTQQITTGTK